MNTKQIRWKEYDTYVSGALFSLLIFISYRPLHYITDLFKKIRDAQNN